MTRDDASGTGGHIHMNMHTSKKLYLSWSGERTEDSCALPLLSQARIFTHEVRRHLFYLHSHPQLDLSNYKNAIITCWPRLGIRWWLQLWSTCSSSKHVLVEWSPFSRQKLGFKRNHAEAMVTYPDPQCDCVHEHMTRALAWFLLNPNFWREKGAGR